MSDRAARSLGRAGLPVALLLAALLGACADQADPSRAPAAPASTTTAAPTTAAPTTSVATTSSIPASTSARLPKPIREVKQGDRLVGVYWLATSSARLAPVERGCGRWAMRLPAATWTATRGHAGGWGLRPP
ncbi:MAG TPA: hypothetical protein VHA34_07165 [Actinomycetes bacterium]|nr:hypothetical protein [Actinomycetes bacterium]